VLTLTGPGGSGKTRLAVQAAAEVVDEREHGVWWVGLQAVRDPALVLPTIGSTLGAKGPLAEHVAGRHMLLPSGQRRAGGGLGARAGELLAACPNLTLLVTSREPLRLAAEQEYPVPPFVEQESVGFFFSRARSARPEFEDDGSVRAICDRLDHLPLALELAAARVKALSPRRSWSGSSEPAAPDRRRTRRAGAPEDAAGDDRLEPRAPLAGRAAALPAPRRLHGRWLARGGRGGRRRGSGHLQSLVEKSLLRFDGERYAMLETIREYAAGSCHESRNEGGSVRHAHGEFFLALAETADMSAESDYGRPYDILPPEQENSAGRDRSARRCGRDRARAPAGDRARELLGDHLTRSRGARTFESLLASWGRLEPPARPRVCAATPGTST
jgi:predicted ATPase